VCDYTMCIRYPLHWICRSRSHYSCLRVLSLKYTCVPYIKLPEYYCTLNEQVSWCYPTRYDNDIHYVAGRAMAQAVSRYPLSAEARVRAQASPCGICGLQIGIGQVFLVALWVSSCWSSYYPCSIPICHRPMRCAIALTQQHIIIPSVLT